MFFPFLMALSFPTRTALEEEPPCGACGQDTTQAVVKLYVGIQGQKA